MLDLKAGQCLLMSDELFIESPGLTGNSEAPWAVEVTYFREIGHLLSCLTLCDPIDCSLQFSPSMGFSRQEYQSRLPFPSPEDLPNPGKIS